MLSHHELATLIGDSPSLATRAFTADRCATGIQNGRLTRLIKQLITDLLRSAELSRTSAALRAFIVPCGA